MSERLSLLISPRAEAAYFAQCDDVALAELSGLPGVQDAKIREIGGMRIVSAVFEAPDVKALRRLSFVQGIFQESGDALRPLDESAGFSLHPDFVWGEKYKGKTNETLTQLMLNLALQELGKDGAGLRLLDPMCGRGTTLFWAMRFGMTALGVEQDPAVQAEMRRGLKKWTKLHRVKHKLEEGWVNKANKKGLGKYLEFVAEGSSSRVITGDTCDAYDLIQRKTVDVIATDIPYGVQHMGGKGGMRNPLDILTKAAPVWTQCLRPGGVMAISFNANLPKRPALEECFTAHGLEIIPRPVAHRMSESILRDVALLRKPD